MQLILASNVLEHKHFPDFMRDMRARHRGAWCVISGDLLNVFPEPGEDLCGSIFHELYGDVIVSGLDALVRDRFKSVKDSILLPFLRNMFLPTGSHYQQAKEIAQRRYRRLFDRIENARVLFIPGNMDFPRESEKCIIGRPNLVQLDQEILEISSYKIGGVGGIPNTCHPFRGLVEISPYEMHEEEYRRRLFALTGVDVLLTHLSPEESPALAEFLRDTPVKLLICRAPFNFARSSDFRGALQVHEVSGKSVVHVRPFDYPVNNYYVLNLAPDSLSSAQVTMHRWEATVAGQQEMSL